jgi:hypothetical protein
VLRRRTVGFIITASVWVFALAWVPYALAPNPLTLAVTLAAGSPWRRSTTVPRWPIGSSARPTPCKGRVIGVARLITYGGQAAGYLILAC